MTLSPQKVSPMVEIKNVTVRFQEVEAVRNISLQVDRGTIFGLVGSDGAGKSTLLRLIATMIQPIRGEIYINGLHALIEKRKIKNIIGYMPQRFGLYQDLTVDENMRFFMDVFNVPRTERKSRREKYLGFSHLLPFTGRLAGDLSGGMKQKLGLACVLVHEPQLLILDEPTNGVDPVSRHEFWEILGNMQKEGMTIIVSTAYLDEGEKCDRIGLMHKADLLEISSPAGVRGNFPTLEEAMIERLKIADGELSHETFRI